MGTLSRLYNSSIGKKLMMGTTGLCLCVYLIVHLGGNMLLFKNDGGAAFDTYAEVLPQILLIRIVEIVLFAVFAWHIVVGTILWVSNKRARPDGYRVNRGGETSALTSRIMFMTGLVVFVFLVIHMRAFWFTSRFQAGEQFSMYRVVASAFANPVTSAFYVLAMGLLGFHLRHGFQSALQTFGIRHQRYAPLIEALGAIFWLAIPAAFAAMPLLFFFRP